MTNNPPVSTIDDVLDQLTDIIDRSHRRKSRLGFFSALYRRVTIAVKQGIADGRFEDGERMAQLDVRFANRYLEAYHAYFTGHRPTESWRVAFEAAARPKYIILQHLLLGINAHINLDLGIAAAQTAPGDSLPALENDFNAINKILASLVDEVQDEIASVSPAIKWLDRTGGRTDEEIVNFSMQVARREAWNFAQHLALLNKTQQADAIKQRDRETVAIARLVTDPGWLAKIGLWLVRRRESQDVPQIIDVLSAD